MNQFKLYTEKGREIKNRSYLTNQWSDRPQTPSMDSRGQSKKITKILSRYSSVLIIRFVLKNHPGYVF